MKEILQKFQTGLIDNAYKFLGSHLAGDNCTFRVWAPKAKNVCVVGDFNNWDTAANPMHKTVGGIWECEISGVKQFDKYKYAVTARNNKTTLKSDPFAKHFETVPGNCSKVYNTLDFDWQDAEYIKIRKARDKHSRPINIYEVHLGSWRRQNGKYLNYTDIANQLSKYVLHMGYNYVEILPISEHPFDGSWGYQGLGYFAPTSRFGTPHDFMQFVDIMHKNGIGVILDWVPAHFPKDQNGLYSFDGTPCYEYADKRKGEHKVWGTAVFNYGKTEVTNFLISSAAYWVREYHIDGLRVDAVASMLYLDYGREDWLPNKYGGKEHLEAIKFLQRLNGTLHGIDSSILTFAEESTAWPLVTGNIQSGGLGFDFKWNMGWMNDMLHYISLDPYFRSFNHNCITFSLVYAFSENFVLPISHDEVVHLKRSMYGKMWGKKAQRFNELKAFFAYMMAHPGKKLMFMGQEFAATHEWNHDTELDWALLDDPQHKNFQAFVRALNNFYLNTPELWEIDFSWDGFCWISHDDHQNSVISFRRKTNQGEEIIAVCNFTPVRRQKYRIGAPICGSYKRVFCTDWEEFGGNTPRRLPSVRTSKKGMHGYSNSLVLDIPPTSVTFYKKTTRKNKIL